MFDRRTTAFHFADSLAMNWRISSEVLPQSSMSNSRSRRLVSPPFAIAANACESRLTIAASVEFGATSPNHTRTSMSLNPSSASVGTGGNNALRRAYLPLRRPPSDGPFLPLREKRSTMLWLDPVSLRRSKRSRQTVPQAPPPEQGSPRPQDNTNQAHALLGAICLVGCVSYLGAKLRSN